MGFTTIEIKLVDFLVNVVAVALLVDIGHILFLKIYSILFKRQKTRLISIVSKPIKVVVVVIVVFVEKKVEKNIFWSKKSMSKNLRPKVLDQKKIG